ncbi:MAG: glycerol acyltransferase [Bacteroidales bacterium]|nr:glycerol acyltransferase [Bacteroidales bacterium]
MPEITEIHENLIDIERVIASKNPTLLKIIPGFIIRYLKRITHQDGINGYIYRNRDKTGLEFVDAILKEFGAEISWQFPVPSWQLAVGSWQLAVPSWQLAVGSNHQSGDPVIQSSSDPVSSYLTTGRYIIASNHPLGGLDGMALMQAVGRIRRDLIFPVNDILMNVPGLQPLFIPINKHGKNTDNVRIIDETFASDKVILYFPAGLVSRKQKGGVIRDLEWKKTFITKARRYHRDVIPVHISGQNSNFFYNLSNWRKRLGIKANIEMLYLVDEMVKQKDKPIRITFGEPIPWSTFDRSRTDSEWAEWVKGIVYSLRDNP